MIVIHLDTNILDADPSRRKSTFGLLNELSAKGMIKICLHKIAYEEHLAHQVEKVQKSARDATSSFSDLRKSYGFVLLLSEIETLELRLTNLEALATQTIKAELDNWIISSQITILDYSSSDYNAIFQAYFEGSAPFKSARSKKDFPDAFIWSAIKTYANTHKEDTHIVISNDTGFANGFSDQENTYVFSGLNDLIGSLFFVPLLEEKRKIDSENTSVNIIKQQLKFHLTYIERQITDLVIQDANDYYEPGNGEVSLDEAIIYAIEEYVDLKINDADAEYIGSGDFLLPIKGTVRLYFDHIFLLNEFYEMHKSEQEDYKIYEEDDKYVLATSTELAPFSTNVIISFGEDAIYEGNVEKFGLGVAIYRTDIWLEETVIFQYG